MKRRFTSLLLIISVMVGLLVPFDLTVFAEDPATGSEIHAFLYYIDTSKTDSSGISIKKNLELVFQRGDVPDPNKTVFRHFTDFADVTSKPAGYRNPWYREDYVGNKGTVFAGEILKVDIKDKIAPKNMAGWFWNFTELTSDNLTHLENIDTSECTTIFYLFCGDRSLTTLDIPSWNWQFPKLTNAGNVFSSCRGLTDVDISTWNMPVNDYIPGMFSSCTGLVNLDISGFRIGKPRIIGSLFDGCTNLKSVQLPDLSTYGDVQLCYMFRNCSSLEEVDFSGWKVSRPGTFMEMFSGCTSLKNVNFGSPDNWGTTPRNWSFNGYYERAYQYMFRDCVSLESLDLTCVKGALICDSMFQGCKNLKEVDLGYAGKGRSNEDPDLSNKANIFEGCDELSMVTLSAEGWPLDGFAGTSVPTKETWAKIYDAAGNKLDGSEVLPVDQLFLHFDKNYAGTWVAVDKIILDANGGKPAFQSINGAKGMNAEFDGSQTATKAGYTFDDWWSEKEGGSKLVNGQEVEAWTYYAHWIENHYNLVLHGNGGKVPADFSMEGATVSEDRETITFSNLSYTQFMDVSSRMFKNEDGSVLASWNIRKNGTGSQQFAGNDSVNKLAVKEGDTAELYAQWHTPSAVVTFDSQGGTEIAARDYEVNDPFGTLSSPTKPGDNDSPAGYTFVGWFTEPGGQGKEIVDKEDKDLDHDKEQNKVIESCTLYAYWMPNCAVTFNANGGEIDGTETVVNVCMYNQSVGMLPTPENGSASFIGWFDDSNNLITSDTVITSPEVTFTAHWGYLPKFETDGGSFTAYSADDYLPSTDPLYHFATLPTVDQYRCIFLGWYADEDGNAENGYETRVVQDSAVDLSHNSTIKAMWEKDAQCTVTLDAAGGTIPGGQTKYKYYKDDIISGLPVPTKNGSEFGGWYDNDTMIVDGTTPVTSDVILTARWIEKDCTVSFNANGGALYDPADAEVKVVHGHTLPTIPGANKKEADGSVQYFFGGWYENADGTGNKLMPDTVIDSNKTYYAKWVDPKNIMKINDDGSTDMSNTLYMYSVTWGSPSDGSVTNNTGDNLVFHPISNGNISALLRIQFYSYDNNTSTDIKLPAGSVRIKIPKYIFKDREGNNIGTDNLNIGLPDHPVTDSDKVHFYYTTETGQDGQEYYVIINSVEMTGKHDDFEIFYEADPNLIEGGYIDENGYYRYTDEAHKYYTNQFNVNISAQAKENDTVIAAKSIDYNKQLSLDVHTRVNTTVQKIQTDVSMKWKSKWGAEPADSDEYYFVTWNLVSRHSSSTQPFSLSWSEDTVRDGAIISGPTNEPETFRKNGTYSTEVVTKHRKDTVHKTETGWAEAHNEAELEVTWLSGYKQHFRAGADAYAYIEDEDESGDNKPTSLKKRIAGSPDEKDDHYKQGAQEEILLGQTISLDYDISYTEKRREDPPVWHPNTGTYTAPVRTMAIEDGNTADLVMSAYSKTPLPYESDWNASNDVNLSENDYYFDKLQINVTEYDAILMNEIWSNPFVHDHVSDYSNDGIVVSIRRVGKTEIENLKPIVHTASATVDLPDDTVWFKVSYSSSFYSTDLQVKPTVCIKATNHIQSYVRDHIEANKDTMIKNRCKMTFTEGSKTPEVLETGPDGTSGWYSAYVFNIGESKLYASKACASKDNVIFDNDTSSESIPAVISGWGYNTTGNKKPMKSASFYDLLPEGYTVDRSSVFIIPRSENTSSSGANANQYISKRDNDAEHHLPAAYYSVSFSDNWNNCGRTLMTVDVNIPDDEIATGVDVYYLMNTNYANVIANGATPNNLFAYKDTTPGQSVPIERNRMLSEMEQKFRSSLAFADSEQTAFNSANLNAYTPSNISSGISSSVRAEGSAISNHQVIGRNSEYTYSISYTSDASYSGEKLVLYDLIERQVGSDISEWKGQFKSIDTSGISSVSNKVGSGKCAPVIYYTTKENFAQSDLDIDNDEIWTTTMPPKDQITAIAVDCRKATDGTDFVLDIKKSLSFDINMHSPGDADNNLTAYNEAYVRGYLSGLHHAVDNITQTRVTIRFTVPQFVKDAFPSTGTIDNPESVVKNSVLEYVLKLTNPDDEVPMENVTVEDILCKSVRVVNAMTVQINDDAPVPIEKAAGISYEVTDVTGGGSKFTATIENIAPKETVIITIPVSVIGEVGEKLTNTANILSVNGVPFDSPVPSNPTYHEISENQVKVLKTNSSGKPLAGAELQILDKDKNVVTLADKDNNDITSFISTDEIMRFNLIPGNYFLREVNAPTDFKPHDDIAFRIDSEGIIYVDNQAVNYVEMRDQPHYKVIFYENNPELDDKNVVFRTYDPNELNEDKSITHFYDIPKWAKDEYVFAGWYHNNTYTKMDTPDNQTLYPSDFEHDTYKVANPNGTDNDPDYHLYAKWIKVGTVDKAAEDTNITAGYRGFGLAGVQIRPKNVKVKDLNTGQFVDADMFDPNVRDKIEGYSDDRYNNEVKVTPEGMRFVTSLSERLLSEVNGIGKIDNTPAEGKTFGVEYGYAVGTENNINTFVNHYGIIDKTTYNLQYQGENVNGVNTTGETKSPETDYRYITNVDCTSDQGKGVKNNRDGIVDYDHRNFSDYRLYTLVITYDTPDSKDRLGEKLDARAYMRYYDANGKLRVFYNTYKENTYYGGCMCSFNQISAMSLPSGSGNTEPTESSEP